MTASATNWFVPLVDPASAGAHVYGMPAAGGGCASFADLAARVGPELALWALNLPGRQARFLEPPRTALDPLVDELAAVLPDTRPPPVLFGYCSGALLAFLLARRRRRAGLAPPGALVVASYPAPHLVRPARTLHLRDSAGFWQEILSYGGVPERVAGQPDFRDIFEPALRADYQLLAGYWYTDEAPLDTPVTVLVGDRDPVLSEAEVQGWRQHTAGPFEVRTLPGDHWLLDSAPEATAAALRAAATATMQGAQ